MPLIQFILFMVLAARKSGNMRQLQCFLDASAKKQAPSAECVRQLMEILADKTVNLTPKQSEKVIMRGLGAFVFSRWLCGKQFGQTSLIRLQPQVLHHMMTMGIPRNMAVMPLSIPQKPHSHSYHFWSSTPDSSFFYPDGFEYNSRTGWTPSFSCGFVHMTTHPSKPFIAITGSDGRVWIGKIGDKTNLFYLMHVPKKEDVRATTCAFHPSENYVAVGVPGWVLVYKFSSSLSIKCEIVKEIRFFEHSGGFCTRPPQYAPCEIQWHPTGESITAVSGNGNLSRKFSSTSGFFQGTSEIRHAYMYFFNEGHLAPLSSCMSSDGKFVATGYSGGRVLINDMFKLDPKSSKVVSVLPVDSSINKIEYKPCDSKILVALSSSRDSNGVYLLQISPDGLTIKILHSFPDAKGFCFYAGMFILQYGTMITFFRLNRDNFPVKMAEFTSKNGHIRSFCFTTLNDVVTICYSSHSNSELHMAAVLGIK